ncbi:MAG: PDR/VanB family oxidoreductase [Azospirillaceae bacterium]
MNQDRIEVCVTRVDRLADRVIGLTLIAHEDKDLPAFGAGAHVDVHLGSNLVRQYSISSDPGEWGRYALAVQIEPAGRGGSQQLDRTVRPGSRLQISRPRNTFPLRPEAERNLFIAGGIGITPIRSMIFESERRGQPWSLVYGARGPAQMAFRCDLARRWPERCTFHFSGEGNRELIPFDELLARQLPGQHLYCCGPEAMLQSVRQASAHWHAGTVHFERFSPVAVSAGDDPADDRAFEIELAQSGEVYTVPPSKSVLEVLRQAGHDVESSCEEGTCGSCAVRVLDGCPDHRDSLGLDDPEFRRSFMMICVSRAQGARLVLDL